MYAIIALSRLAIIALSRLCQEESLRGLKGLEDLQTE